MSNYLKFSIITLSIVAAIYYSKGMKWELNLVTGKAEASYFLLGITYSKAKNIYTPSECPAWNNPKKDSEIKSISYTCYDNLPGLESCANELKEYEATYRSGCNI